MVLMTMKDFIKFISEQIYIFYIHIFLYVSLYLSTYPYIFLVFWNSPASIWEGIFHWYKSIPFSPFLVCVL